MRIQQRQYTKSYGFPDDEQTRVLFVKQLLSQYKFIVTVGLPCTGKSTFLSYYGTQDNTFSIWNREHIFNMLFVGGERDEKLNKQIMKFECDFIPGLLNRPKHQVFIDGYNRLPSGRGMYADLNPGIGKSALLVFDGPPELIMERMCQEPKYAYKMSNEEIVLHVTKLKETTVWPKHHKFYDDIIYINTFGVEGKDYLKHRLNKVVTL